MALSAEIASLFVSIGAKSTMSSDMDKASGQAEKGGKNIGNAFKSSALVVGTAMTSAGLAIVGLADSARETNAELKVTALQLGVTTEDMRALALETTNVTFPLSEVTATFDLLTRAGETNTDVIKEVATQYDTLGDAVGKSASEITGTMTVAMKTWSLSAQESTAYLDDMTYLLRNTTLEMENFDSVVGYTTPELVGLGLGLDDTIAALGVMEGKGMAGAVATREWRSAVTAADGDLNNFYASLGITAEEIESYKGQMEGAEGITQDFADAANTQYGTMDNLRQAWDEFTLSAGSALEPLEGVGAMMAAGGPMLMGLSVLPGMLTGVKTAMLGLNLAMLTSPIFIIAVAIAGVIAILVYLESEFGVVTSAVKIVSDAVSGFIDWITQAVDWSEVLGTALKIMLGPIGLVMMAMEAFGISWEDVWNGMLSVAKSVSDFIVGIFDSIVGTLRTAINWVIEGINIMISGLNTISYEVPYWVPFIGGSKIGFSLPSIPKLAEGGVLSSAGSVMVGEEGPEVLSLPAGASVTPLGAGGVTITGNTFNVRSDRDIKLVATELYSMIDRKNRARGI